MGEGLGAGIRFSTVFPTPTGVISGEMMDDL